MARNLIVSTALLSALFAVTSPSDAIIIGGGGSGSTDCLGVFAAAANQPTTKPRNIRCTDGDASCDGDGTVNGVCTFKVSFCANSTHDPARCNLAGVDDIVVEHALDDGSEKFDPDFQAFQSRIEGEIEPPTNDLDACTDDLDPENQTSIRVFIEGPFGSNGVYKCKKSKKLLKVVSSGIIGGKFVKDTDKLKMQCDPAPGGCDPSLLYLGTFDRIQRQIFDQTCAVSGCHDSQTTEGNLLLETGASHGNLVNVIPDNVPADNAGWKRVTVIDPMVSGDPATSYLYHKLTGDLPQGFGDRMPFERKKLDQSLIEVVRLWIEAGAPTTDTWVPGTD
jgi:hypothetical protein